MLLYLFIILILYESNAASTSEEVQYLNVLTIDKLLTLKNSLGEMAPRHDNVTAAAPADVSRFGAQALAIRAPHVRRTDYEEALVKKGGYGKISNIFSMSVTTLAFLAFGGYLLCLIVQAVKTKQPTVVNPTATSFINSGVKRPPATFSSYGRRRRRRRDASDMDVAPDQLFVVLVQLCEGYAKWSKEHED